ncbi:MAG: hypothetical protein C0480_16585 [Bradyrhizobium sp.]|nr:hypothetical protein [Bradyrhizobium sp.]
MARTPRVPWKRSNPRKRAGKTPRHLTSPQKSAGGGGGAIGRRRARRDISHVCRLTLDIVASGSAVPANLDLPRESRVSFRIFVGQARPFIVPRLGFGAGRGAIERTDDDFLIPRGSPLRPFNLVGLGASRRGLAQTVPGDRRGGHRRVAAGAGNAAAGQREAGGEECQEFRVHRCSARGRVRYHGLTTTSLHSSP